MGKAKKAILLYIFSKRTAIKLGEKWISEDMYNNDINHRDLRKCLRVSFLLRKDED
jgi:hypothetical protein